MAYATDPARNALVREYNGLRRELQDMQTKLERMEAHEGDDGTPEDIDGQCALIEEMAIKRRRCDELRKILYPK